MAQWLIQDTVDLRADAQKQKVGAPEALMLPGDNEAHRWSVTVLNGGGAADLAGASVAGYFLRSDGETVMVVGSVTDGNVVTVTLAQECYAIEGLMRAIVRVTQNGAVTTLIQRLFRVQQDIGDQIIDPGEVIPDIDELLAAVAAMEAATVDCVNATEACETATEAVAANLAPKFSTSSAYSIGDLVINSDDGKLYRFTAAHAAGAWNPTQVISVTVADEFSNIGDELDAINETIDSIEETISLPTELAERADLSPGATTNDFLAQTFDMLAIHDQGDNNAEYILQLKVTANGYPAIIISEVI